VENLEVCTGDSARSLLRNVSFQIQAGERIALVGRSGSGKSLLASAILGLTRPPLTQSQSTIECDGAPIIRQGANLFLIFQNPASALNPCRTVLSQLTRVAQRASYAQPAQDARRALELVGLGEAAPKFPHQLSGGMKQRVLIAMAILLRPRVLIADEPTTGLDPLTQAQVLNNLESLLNLCGASLLFITHDWSLARKLCPTALFLEQGRIAASGRWDELAAQSEAVRACMDAERLLRC